MATYFYNCIVFLNNKIKNNPKVLDIIFISSIFIVCAIFIYIFHFDSWLSSDSAMTGICEIQLLRFGLNNLNKISWVHGFSYYSLIILLNIFFLKSS